MWHMSDYNCSILPKDSTRNGLHNKGEVIYFYKLPKINFRNFGGYFRNFEKKTLFTTEKNPKLLNKRIFCEITMNIFQNYSKT